MLRSWLGILSRRYGRNRNPTFRVSIGVDEPTGTGAPGRPPAGRPGSVRRRRPGITHIGVLKVLHRLRVPVDYVVGTSMGSIVGGLHAAGYEPEELEKIVSTVDWNGLFGSKPARQELTVRRKEQDFRYAWNFEIGVDDSFDVGLPRRAVGSNSLELFLHGLTNRVGDIRDFDRLPTPFRAVATDLESGDAVVFDRGELHRAMRDSMSIPGAFAPIEVDNRILGDGAWSTTCRSPWGARWVST